MLAVAVRGANFEWGKIFQKNKFTTFLLHFILWKFHTNKPFLNQKKPFSFFKPQIYYRTNGESKINYLKEKGKFERPDVPNHLICWSKTYNEYKPIDFTDKNSLIGFELLKNEYVS